MNPSKSFFEITVICALVGRLSFSSASSLKVLQTEIPDDWRNRLTDDAYSNGRTRQESSQQTLFEGDILRVDPNITDQDAISPFASAMDQDSAKWTEGIVSYEITDTFSDEQKELIEEALQDMMDKTCIRFLPRQSQPEQLRKDYITFKNDGHGCASFVGRITGGQTISLMPGCLKYIGEIQHEVMHALGFYHEQNRSDRDDYVTIVWQNVLPGAKDQFEKYQTNNLGMPYDYESVMHYKWNYFSISWGQPTIISNDKGRKVDMGNRKAMTALDVEKINRWYKSECDQREEHDRSSRAEHPSDRPSLAHPSNDTPPITRDSTSPFSVEKPSLKSSATRNIIFLELWMILFIVISYVSMSFFL